MKIKISVYILFLLAVTASAAMGQSGSGAEEGDPFRNDPFFSKPLHELLNRPGHTGKDRENDGYNSEWSSRRYLGRINEEGIDFGGILEAGPYSSNPLYGLYPGLPMIHYNRVNGLFLGLRKERMQWWQDDWLSGIRSIQPHGMIGYSFGQEEWQYTLGLEKFLGRKKHIIIGGEYHNATSTNDHWRVGMMETSLTSFFGGYDYLDYYKQTGWGGYLLLRTDRLFEGGIGFSDGRFSSLEQETDYALFGSGNRYRVNPPVEYAGGNRVDTVGISSLTFTASFNPKRLVFSRYFTFSLTGSVEIGDPGIGSSDYSYTKYLGELVSYINFEPGAIFKYRLKAGTIHGDAPLFKEFRLGGIGSLRALPYKSLPASDELWAGGNQMILSNAEIHFGSPTFGSDGWIDSDDFYLSLFLDSGWVSYRAEFEASDKSFADFSTFRFSDLKHNGGVGLGSSFIRCELAWDLNHTSRAPVFWIRLNPTF